MKLCSDCGVEKPLTKFYRFHAMEDGLMPWCKACHNGLTKWHKEQTTFFSERQLGDPSETAIQIACQKIQAGWSDKQRQRRRRSVA